MYNHRIKDTIKKLRVQLGFTQADMADMLKISLNSYRKIEQGDTNLVSKRLEDIAKILKVSGDELLLGYSPSEGFNEKLEDMRVKYFSEKETRIVQLEKLLEEKDNRILFLEEMIEDKKAIIEHMKKEKGS